MTGGIGFTKLGQSLQKINRSFLNHTRKVKDKRNDLTYRYSSKKYVYKKTSSERLKNIRREILKERRKEVIKSLLLIFVIAILMTVVFVSAFF